MKNTYIPIIEHCGHEGETWFTFLQEQGNEKFISDLKFMIEQFEEEMEGGDSWIKVEDYHKYSAMEVRIMEMTFNKHMNGYKELVEMKSKVREINWKEISDVEEFVQIFYKGGLFR